MLRSNLSTRPFYNERAVHLVIGLAAVLVLGFTMFNVQQIVSLSNENTELAARAADGETRARQLRASAQRTRSNLDAKQIEVASAWAREANAIIDRRLFSWTELFNYLETTLPDDVRITTIRPRTDPSRGVSVAITVNGRRVEDVDQFMNALEATGAFRDVLSRDERPMEDGSLLAVLEARYLPEQGGKVVPAAQQTPEKTQP